MIVVVNATALDTSGALIILKQFINAIPTNKIEWIIFMSDKVRYFTNNPTIRLVSVSHVKSLPKRFIWDLFGVKRWLKKEGIRPCASLSLQNTGFQTGYHIPTYIYYHQSISFYKRNWSFFKKDQRPLWFYKNIYPFFVKLFINQETEIFVQLNYIKEEFIKKYKVSPENIYVISPSFVLPDKNTIHPIHLPNQKINLFYPATSYFYKNHTVVIEALNQINSDFFSLYVTMKKNEFLPKRNFIHFLGKIPYAKVLSMYMAADALVFPSYIETYGLPLLEAASLGMPILAADLPYAREVLKGYEGVTFIDHTKPEDWKRALMKLKKGVRYLPFKRLPEAGWPFLFDRIETKK